MTDVIRRLVLGALSVCILSPVAQHAAPAPVVVGAERTLRFNEGWRFFKGEATGAERAEFDDSQWRQVRLPHDWAIEGPFDVRFDANTGGLPVSGTGWYRRSFVMPESARNRFVAIQFDGAMSNARVWLNGSEIGGRPYGYSSFSLDLTPHMRFGGPNVIAVRLTPEDRSSRFYPGAGIYRNVWLVTTGPVSVTPGGVQVTSALSGKEATVKVKVELRNRRQRDAAITLRASLLDQSGKQVAQKTSAATIAATALGTAEASLTVSSPELWDLDRPYLYTVVTEVVEGGTSVDRVS